MFSTAINTINKISSSSVITTGYDSTNSTNKLFGIGGSTRNIYQTESYKAYRAAEDAAWAKMTWLEKIGSFF